jgi:3-deoxy-manno-octulosonate cytidylyltransferase (CMP-KDO synthetase)
MRSVVIIPARFSSSRYPGKPLVEILGKPMIIWVAELSAKAVGVENVYVATEDIRIKNEVEKFGYSCVLTSKTALTGTDRVAEAARMLLADIYINVQGDEPMLNPSDILKVRDAKILSMNTVINGFNYISLEEANNLNVPKVVTDESDHLVYMSRAVIPGFKDIKDSPSKYKKQVCIYAFTRDELNAFISFGRKSRLEQTEDIEILRFLDMDIKVKFVETTPGSLAVDVPDDLSAVEIEINNKLNA